MAVRKVVTRSGRGVRGYYPSRKMKQMIPWESKLEEAAILLFEFSPGVVGYRGQPVHVYFDMDGEERHYIPDFELVLRNSRVTHIEVKPESKLAKAELVKRFAAIRKDYQQNSASFKILTETVLYKQPQLKNLQLLAYHQLRITDETNLKDALQNLTLLPAKTIAGAAAILGSERQVYQLIAEGHYWCNLDFPLSPETEIYPKEEADDDALLF